MRIFLSGIVLCVLINSSACAFAQPIKILALGDSYTIGEGVEAKDSWPMQFKERLQSNGIDIAAVDIVARSGWTTRNLLSALEHESLQHDYDLVFVLIGANDQFQKIPISYFSRGLNDIFLKAIAYGQDRPARVFAVSIPDWGFSPYAAGRNQENISAQIDNFNQAAEDLAHKLGIGWINITDFSRLSVVPEDFVEDGLHPAAATYRGWVDRIVPAVEEILKRKE